MQTRLAPALQATQTGRNADAILRKCTHCGFCLATCPTYQLSGDERDSPRGRIYLIKQMLESGEASQVVQTHLDRCLTCRSCETTCPSGVAYSQLLDIGRHQLETAQVRPAWSRIQRAVLRQLLRPVVFRALLGLGRLVRPAFPTRIRSHVPPVRPLPAWPAQRRHAPRVLLLEGCVQPALDRALNPLTAQLLDRLGIGVIRSGSAACCGAIDQHLGHTDRAMKQIRRNLDAWWPLVTEGLQGIVINASGCGVQVRDYGRLMADDPEYAERARQVMKLAIDPVELLLQHESHLQAAPDAPKRIAFQSPCTLQHGLKLGGQVEALLRRLGFDLTPVQEAHLCCGSAGTYSLLQPEWAGELRARKLAHLTAGKPALIATANIGCQMHLQAGTDLPVRHWLELLEVA